MGSAAMKVKKQGCVNRSSLEHSMVITLVRSEFELEAIWLLFYGWTALLKWQKWKNDENQSKSPSILREIIFPENRLIADFFCSIPSRVGQKPKILKKPKKPGFFQDFWVFPWVFSSSGFFKIYIRLNHWPTSWTQILIGNDFIILFSNGIAL